MAEAKKLAKKDAAAKKAADAALAAIKEKELAKLLAGPAKCPAYSYASAAQEANTTAEKCTGTKCDGYRGKQTMTISGKTCQVWAA